ncbi:MAG: homoserine O-succinyltransferase [Lysobacterales bacterium]|nr:MAG: homoserine O-succinyltransferase [Xanthomonadales bacterium]
MTAPQPPSSAVPAAYEWRTDVHVLPGPWPLHHGGRLEHVEVAYRLCGAPGAPVVAVLGGISAGRDVVSLDAAAPGWWEEAVGPGRALDTDRYRCLGVDFLGGSHRTTGPAEGETFPTVSAFDQARVLVGLMDHLGIDQLAASLGASYGGMVTLALAQAHPERVRHAVVLSAAHRTHPMSTAWRSVQRNVVRYALAHGEGPRGLVLARALAMATYRSAREFEERFPGPPEATPEGFRFPVESYLLARGQSYAAVYKPEAFVCLSESIDLHRVEPESIRVPTTLLGVQEDQLVPISDMRELRDRHGGNCSLVEITSIFGHDAFLKETEVLRDLLARALDRP